MSSHACHHALIAPPPRSLYNLQPLQPQLQQASGLLNALLGLGESFPRSDQHKFTLPTDIEKRITNSIATLQRRLSGSDVQLGNNLRSRVLSAHNGLLQAVLHSRDEL